MELCLWCASDDDSTLACNYREYVYQHQEDLPVPHVIYCTCHCYYRQNVALLDKTKLSPSDKALLRLKLDQLFW